MDESEIMVLVVGAFAGLGAAAATRTGGLHRLARRDNPGLGLVRLSVLGSLIWLAWVIRYYADPSVRGIYVPFYLVLGYAAVKLFGQVGARLFGVDTRVDAGERKNYAAAVFIAGFTLGTGLIFGGSLWGEADPSGGGGEGGWWIPVGFFLMGWLVMAVAVAVYVAREPGSFRAAIRQERSAQEAWAAASFTVSTAWLMTSAVSGDFFGWASGVKDVGLAAGLLLLHELLRTPQGHPQPGPIRRMLESGLYMTIALGNWVLPRLLGSGAT